MITHQSINFMDTIIELDFYILNDLIGVINFELVIFNMLVKFSVH